MSRSRQTGRKSGGLPICSLILVGSFVLASAAPLSAGHRKHPIVDPQNGYCEHGRCARARIKSPLRSDLDIKLGLFDFNAELKLRADALTALSKEARSSALQSRLVAKAYNNCAITLNQWQEWFARYTSIMEANAALRGQLLLKVFDLLGDGKITGEESEALLRVLLDSAQSAQGDVEKGLAVTAKVEPDADATSEGKLEKGKAQLLTATEVNRDVEAAAATGQTKGAESPPVTRLRTSPAVAISVAARLEGLGIKP